MMTDWRPLNGVVFALVATATAVRAAENRELIELQIALPHTSLVAGEPLVVDWRIVSRTGQDVTVTGIADSFADLHFELRRDGRDFQGVFPFLMSPPMRINEPSTRVPRHGLKGRQILHYDLETDELVLGATGHYVLRAEFGDDPADLVVSNDVEFDVRPPADEDKDAFAVWSDPDVIRAIQGIKASDSGVGWSKVADLARKYPTSLYGDLARKALAESSSLTSANTEAPSDQTDTSPAVTRTPEGNGSPSKNASGTSAASWWIPVTAIVALAALLFVGLRSWRRRN